MCMKTLVMSDSWCIGMGQRCVIGVTHFRLIKHMFMREKCALYTLFPNEHICFRVRCASPVHLRGQPPARRPQVRRQRKQRRLPRASADRGYRGEPERSGSRGWRRPHASESAADCRGAGPGGCGRLGQQRPWDSSAPQQRWRHAGPGCSTRHIVSKSTSIYLQEELDLLYREVLPLPHPNPHTTQTLRHCSIIKSLLKKHHMYFSTDRASACSSPCPPESTAPCFCPTQIHSNTLLAGGGWGLNDLGMSRYGPTVPQFVFTCIGLKPRRVSPLPGRQNLK